MDHGSCWVFVRRSPVAASLIDGYRTAAALVNNLKDMSVDKAVIRLRLEAEEGITIRVRDLLFARKPSQRGAALFDQLDPRTQNSIHAIFQLFLKTVEEYVPLGRKHLIDTRSAGGDDLLSEAHMERLRQTDYLADLPPLDHRHTFTRQKALSWVLRDKRQMGNLVAEIEQWNKKFDPNHRTHLPL